MGLKKDLEALKRGTGSLREQAVLCNNIGNYYFSRQDYHKSLEYFKKDLHLSESLSPLSTAKAHRKIGECYAMIHDFNQAVNHHLIYYDLCKDMMNREEEQRALTTLGNTYLDQAMATTSSMEAMDLLKKSQDYYERSLAIIEDLSVTESEKANMASISTYCLGQVLEASGNLATAEEETKKAIGLARTAHDMAMVIKSLMGLGGIKGKKGEVKAAVEAYQEGADLAETENMLEQAHICLSNMALNQMNSCQEVEAHKTYRRALKLATKCNDKTAVDILKEGVKLSRKRAKARAKIQEYEASVAVAEVTGDRVEHLKGLEGLADVYVDLEAPEKAVDYYRKVLLIANKLYEERLATGEGVIDGTRLDSLHISLALSYQDCNMHDEAMNLLHKTIALDIQECNPTNQSYAWQLMVVSMEALGKPIKEQLEAAELALKCAKEGNNIPYQADSLKMLADKWEAIGNDSKASECRQDANQLQPLSQQTAEMEDAENDSESDTESIEAEIKKEEEERQQELARAKENTEKYRMLSRRNVKGETRLAEAAIAGNLPLVVKLVGEGADINVKDYAYWTPLHEASLYGHTEIVEFLLAQPNIEVNSANIDSVTPLHDAALNGHDDIADLLIRAGANLESRNSKNQRPLEVARYAAVDVIKRAMEAASLDVNSLSPFPSPPGSPCHLGDRPSRRKKTLREVEFETYEMMGEKFARAKPDKRTEKPNGNSPETDAPMASHVVIQSDDSDLEQGTTTWTGNVTAKRKRIDRESHLDGFERDVGGGRFVVSDSASDSEEGKGEGSRQNQQQLHRVEDSVGNGGTNEYDYNYNHESDHYDQDLVAENDRDASLDDFFSDHEDSQAIVSRIPRGNVNSINRPLHNESTNGYQGGPSKRRKTNTGNPRRSLKLRSVSTNINQKASQRRPPVNKNKTTKYFSTNIPMFFDPDSQLQKGNDQDEYEWDNGLASPDPYDDALATNLRHGSDYGPKGYSNSGQGTNQLEDDNHGTPYYGHEIADSPSYDVVTVEAEGRNARVQITILKEASANENDNISETMPFSGSLSIMRLRDLVSHQFQMTYGVVTDISAFLLDDGLYADDYACAGEILVHNQIIKAVIRDWTPMPLPDRYKCLCASTSVAMVPAVLAALVREERHESTITFENLPLGGASTMKFIWSGGNNITPSITSPNLAMPLLRSLAGQTSIQRLSLVNCGLGDGNVPELRDMLKSLPLLEDLSLANNMLTSRCLHSLVDGWPLSLIRLDVSYNDLGDDANQLSALLNANASTLQYLAANHVGLDDNSLGNDGPMAIALAKCLHLSSLSLGHNENLTGPGVAALLRHIPVTVTKLDLSGLPLCEIPVNPVSESPLSSAFIGPSPGLEPPSQPNFNSQWVGDGKFTDLSLAQCCVGDRGAAIIGRAMDGSGSLECITTLNLYCCLIGPKGCDILAESLTHNQSIRYLSLEGNDITDTGATAIARALQTNQSLQTLNLGSCSLTATGVLQLFMGLTVGNTSTHLDTMIMCANPVSVRDDDLTNMILAIERLSPCLRIVDLSFCFTDDGIEIKQVKPSLIGGTSDPINDLDGSEALDPWYLDSDDDITMESTAQPIKPSPLPTASGSRQEIWQWTYQAWRGRARRIGARVSLGTPGDFFLSLL